MTVDTEPWLWDLQAALEDLQVDVYAWQQRAFPDHADLRLKALKIAEEAGEVCGAVVKMLESSPRKTLHDVEQEIGDVTISLVGLCCALDSSFGANVVQRWGEVRERDYTQTHTRGYGNG